MNFKFHFLIVTCFLYSPKVNAGYNPADSNYVKAAMLISPMTDSAFLSVFTRCQLDPNYVFQIPIDSVIKRPNYSAYNSPTYYNHHSSGGRNIFKGLVELITAPIIAVAKALGGISHSTYSNNSEQKKIDSSKVEIETFSTTLMAELFRRNYYSREGKLYLHFREYSATDWSSLDTLPTKYHPHLLQKLFALSCFLSDTSTITYLLDKKVVHIDSSFFEDVNKLHNAFLLASFRNDKLLVEYLVGRHANPLVETRPYRKEFFTMGKYSWVGVSGAYAPKKKSEMYLTPLQLATGKAVKKIIRSSTKIWLKELVGK